MKFSEVINLTPHEIVFQEEDGVRHHIPPSGAVLRCGFEEMANKATDEIGMVRVLNSTKLTLEGTLDPNLEKRIAIVSGMCAQHPDIWLWGVNHELSCVAPDTRIGFDIREDGKTVAVKGWLCYNMPDFTKVDG